MAPHITGTGYTSPPHCASAPRKHHGCDKIGAHHFACDEGGFCFDVGGTGVT